MREWDAEDVATLVEKTGSLIAILVRRAKTPNLVLREITNLTQKLREGEAEIDKRVEALYDTTTDVADPEKDT